MSRFPALVTGVAASILLIVTWPAAAAPACPAQDFDGFIAKFTEDVDVQRAFTVQPLEWTSIDAEATPEPKPKTEMKSGEGLEFPVILNAHEQSKNGVQTQLNPIGEDREWKVFVPDTGDQVRYLFRKRTDGSCWELYKVSDDTL